MHPVVRLARAADGCVLCRLCERRTQVVFGGGSPEASIVFVTEAPGYREDRAGQLLTGPAGDLFDEMLAEAGLDRDDVYLTSVVKCRPPANRSPHPDEVEACEGYLFRQLAEIRPGVVVTLGNLPLRLVTGRPHVLARVHGRPMHALVQGRPTIVFPLFHPAAALHAPALRAELQREIREVPRLARSAATSGAEFVVEADNRTSPDQAPAAAHAPAGSQLALELP